MNHVILSSAKWSRISSISRAKLAHEQQRFNSDMVILADVNAQPSHINKPLMQRIEYFSSLEQAKGLIPAIT